MRRMHLLAILSMLLMAIAASAADEAGFTTPQNADQVVRARDVPFRLHFDSDHWIIQPQESKLKLLARVIHLDEAVTGAFSYRERTYSRQGVRRREVYELDSAFASHTIEYFGQRRVNGLDVLFMKAHATTSGGREVAIRSYLWLGPEGTADYGLVINADQLEQYESQMMDLLNGLERASKKAGAGAMTSSDAGK